MSIENLCLQEAGHLVMRSPKYWCIVFLAYLSFFDNAITAKVFRASYFFCRHIDDVLDGDRTLSSDPIDYVQSVLMAMDCEQGGPEIVELYRFAVSHLVDIATSGENPSEHFKRVIKDAMLFDYERVQARRILTKEELEQYYRNTFAPVMDLSLMIAGSSQRSSDLPESITSQGHIYSIRDLGSDLSQGIINIPSEELARSDLPPDRPLTKDDVTRDRHLSDWISSEISLYHRELAIWKSRLGDKGARKICLPLIWQMDVFCRLYKVGIF